MYVWVGSGWHIIVLTQNLAKRRRETDLNCQFLGNWFNIYLYTAIAPTEPRAVFSTGRTQMPSLRLFEKSHDAILFFVLCSSPEISFSSLSCLATWYSPATCNEWLPLRFSWSLCSVASRAPIESSEGLQFLGGPDWKCIFFYCGSSCIQENASHVHIGLQCKVCNFIDSVLGITTSWNIKAAEKSSFFLDKINK